MWEASATIVDVTRASTAPRTRTRPWHESHPRKKRLAGRRFVCTFLLQSCLYFAQCLSSYCERANFMKQGRFNECDIKLWMSGKVSQNRHSMTSKRKKSRSHTYQYTISHSGNLPPWIYGSISINSAVLVMHMADYILPQFCKKIPQLEFVRSFDIFEFKSCFRRINRIVKQS